MTTRLVLAVVVGAILWSVAGFTVRAEPPYIATCGTVRAFTEPTPTAPGSVTIGTYTFALHTGDRFPSTTPLGAAMCINRTVTTSGPVLALIAMPAPICGFAGIVEAIPGQRGELLDVVTTTPDLRIALPVSAAVASEFRGAATACFEVGLHANGNAFAARVMGATAAAPTPRPTPAPISRLPSTATAERAAALGDAARVDLHVWDGQLSHRVRARRDGSALHPLILR